MRIFALGAAMQTTSPRSLPGDLNERMEHLAGLPRGWDDRGASPPTPWAVRRTRELLHSLAASRCDVLDDLFLAPAPDGGLRLEWVSDADRELTLIVPPDDETDFQFYRFAPTPPFEHLLRTDAADRLDGMLAWLYQDDTAEAAPA